MKFKSDSHFYNGFKQINNFFSEAEHQNLLQEVKEELKGSDKNFSYLDLDLYNDENFIANISSALNLPLKRVKKSDPNKIWILQYFPNLKTPLVDGQNAHRDLKRYNGLQLRLLIPLFEDHQAKHELFLFNEETNTWNSIIYRNRNVYLVEAGKLLHYCKNDPGFSKMMLVMDLVTDQTQNIVHKSATWLLNIIHSFKEKSLNYRKPA